MAICSADTAPTVISTGSNGIGPVGIYASDSQVLYSHPFCETTAGTRTINSLGGATFATLPDQLAGSDLFRTCAENYFAVSSGSGGFSAGSAYVSAVMNQNPTNPASGINVILREPGNSVFATLPAGFTSVNHVYVAFDNVGTFSNALIAAGENSVLGYNSSGAVVFQYGNPVSNTYAIEGAAVAPSWFSACPGCLFVVAAGVSGTSGAILVAHPGLASGSSLTVWSTNVPQEPESIQFVPSLVGTFNGFSYFVSGFNTPPSTNAFTSTGVILAYTPAQLAPFAGQFLVPDEVTGVIWAYSGPNSRTVFSSTGYQLEDASLVPDAPPVTTTGSGCPATFGYWKHHPFPSSMFDSTGHITFGTGSYTASDLVNVLNTPPAKGNATLILAHQLIAAVANVDAGAQVTPDAANAIQQAEQLLINFHLNFSSFVDASSALGQQMTALAGRLDNFNSAKGMNCTEGAGLH